MVLAVVMALGAVLSEVALGALVSEVPLGALLSEVPLGQVSPSHHRSLAESQLWQRRPREKRRECLYTLYGVKDITRYD